MKHSFEVEAGGRLDKALAAAMPEVTRSRLSTGIKDGGCKIDGQVVRKPSAKVRAGQRVDFEMPEPSPNTAEAQDLPLDIIYQDQDIVVVNKAPGMVVHPGAGNYDKTLVNALLFHVKDLSGIGGVVRPGIVHRLDKGTSGLMVVAKNDAAHQHLAAQFAAHTAGRRYLAVTGGVPSGGSGTMRTEIGRHPVHRVRYKSRNDGQGKPAVTHWRVLAENRPYGLVECQLETGRTHQVRVHMSELGASLINDPLYAPRKQVQNAKLRAMLPPERAMLHAWALRLTHPRSEKRMRWTVEPPADFQSVLVACGLPADPVAALREELKPLP